MWNLVNLQFPKLRTLQGRRHRTLGGAESLQIVLALIQGFSNHPNPRKAVSPLSGGFRGPTFPPLDFLTGAYLPTIPFLAGRPAFFTLLLS